MPPHVIPPFGAVSTPQGILYVPPPGQVPTTQSSERASGARTTSPMPPRDSTPPRASEERSASVGSAWPPHHLSQRAAHPQHSPVGVPPNSRPTDYPQHPTPPPRSGVIHRSITQGTVIMEHRTSEASHVNTRFDALVNVAANAQHVSVPGKDRHHQLSPGLSAEQQKDRAEHMAKVSCLFSSFISLIS